MWDLVHRLSVVQSIANQAVTNGNTATNGTGIAITGYESISALLRISAFTDGTYTPSLQVSNASAGTYYAVDAASYIGGAAPGSVAAVGDTLIGIMMLTSALAVAGGIANTGLTFMRVVVTQAGGTSGATFQADLILGHPRHSGVAV